MIFHKLLFVLLYLNALLSPGQNVFINLCSENLETDALNVFSYTDAFTNQKKKLFSGIMKKNDTLIIPLSIEKTERIHFQTTNYQWDIIAQKNAAYTINIDPNTSYGFKTFDTKKNIGVTVFSEDSINHYLYAINTSLENFLQSNFNYQSRRLPRIKTQIFIDSLAAVFKNHSPYLTQHITYHGFILKNASNSPRTDLLQQIGKENIAYHHPSYAQMFLELFNGIDSRMSLSNKDKLMGFINQEKNANKAIKLLKEEFPYFNDTLTGLIFIDLLKDNRNNPSYNKAAVDFLLEEQSHIGVGQNNQHIARYFRDQYQWMAVGKKAPNVELIDLNQSPIDIELSSKEYTYLSFWASWSEESLNQQAVLNSLREDYKGIVRIICINMDETFELHKNMLNLHKDWASFYPGNRGEMIEQYNLKSIPANYLLDPNGDIIQSPATDALSGLSNLFKRIAECKKNNTPLILETIK